MYNVGDILWIVSEKRPGVMPYSVIEEVTKKTILGVETVYFVESLQSGKKFRLDNMPGEKFSSVEEAKSQLLKKAEAAIDKMLDIGKNLISIRQDNNTAPTQVYVEEDNPPTIQDTSEEEPNYVEQEIVELPDGTKAKINIIGDLP